MLISSIPVFADTGKYLKYLELHNMDDTIKKTILLVEDEAIISLSTSKMLKKYGYDVITSLKGEKAIELVKKNPAINLVLMDINLGKGIDGVEAAQKILEIKPIPIIFLTSHSEQPIVDRVKTITRYGYVIKNAGEFVLLESISMAYELFDVNQKLLEDIDERRKAESSLKLSESKFETIFSSNPAGISINDINTGEFIDVNEAFSDIIGVNRSGLIGNDPYSLNLWNEEYNELLTKDLMATGKLQNREIIYTSEVTGKRNLVVSCELIELSGKTCVLTILNDITENKINQEALDESRKIIESTHKTAMLESWVYEYSSGKLHLGNKGKMSGFNENTLVGFDFFLAKTYPDDLEYHKKEITKLLKGHPIEIEIRLLLNNEIKWFLVKADIELDLKNKPVKALGVTLDITNRKQAEEENLKNISLLKATLESTADGILAIDLNSKVKSYNKRFIEMWDVPVDLLHKGDDSEALKFVLNQLSEPEQFIKKINWLKRNPKIESFDKVYFKSGKVLERYSIPQIINNDIVGRVWSFRDITEKNNYEKALKESEEKTRAVISAVPDLIFIVDKEGVYIDYISSTDKKLITSPDKFIGKSFYDVLEKSLAENAVKCINTALLKNELVTFEYNLTLEGCKNFFESRIVPFTKDKVIIIVRDITEEKNTELFSVQRERILAQIAKFAEIIFTTGLNDTNMNYILSELGNALNLSRTYIFKKGEEDDSKIIFQQVFEWCKPGISSSADVLDVENFIVEKASPFYVKFHDFAAKGYVEGYFSKMDNDYEKYIMQVQGLKSYLFISIVVNNRFWGMIGFDECDYERKWQDFEIQALKTAANLLSGALQNIETEKELALSRQMYYDFIYNSPDSVTVSNTDGRIIFSSKKALELFGYVEDDDLEKMTIMDFVAPKSREIAYSKLLKILNTGEYDSNVFTVKRKDGTEFEAEVSASIYNNSAGKLEGLIIVCRDITEKLEIERKLKEEHIRRKILIDESGDGIVVLDENGKVFETNKKFAEMLGYTIDELMSKYVWDWDIKIPKEQIQFLIKDADERGHHFETIHKRKDGTFFDVELSNNGAFIDGKKLIFCVCRDVTKRNSILKKLKESEERFYKIFKNSPVGISLTRISDGVYVDVNDALLKIGGYTKDEVIGKTTVELKVYDENTRDKFIEKLVKEGRVDAVEHQFPRKDGSIAYVIFSLEIVELNGEKFILGIIMDNTERKLNEIKLKESEEKFSKIFQSSPVGIAITKASTGEYVDVNKALLEMSGKKRDELIGKTSLQTLEFSNEERVKLVNEIMNNEKMTYTEMKYKMPNKETAIAAFFMDKFELENEKFILTTVFDITDKKKQEAAIKKSLNEKDILLKELQHRVKNNLSVISSLLNLEIENLNDENDRNIFRNSISRVNSLSAIYEQLYSSDDLENINIYDYLQKLLSSINIAYGKNEKIKIELDICKDCKIDLKRSVVIGLIFNELITNSFKYAFPDNSVGVINVGFQTDDKKAMLYVFDNGIGLQKDFNIESQKSLGLKLVKMMTEQLDGSFNIYSKNGTYSEVVFDLK